MKKIVPFIVCISLMLIIGCSTTPQVPIPQPTIITNAVPIKYCDSQEILDYLDLLKSTIDIYTDQLKVADATSRVALSGPVSQLQETKRSFSDVEAPPCTEKLHTYFISSMNKFIDYFLAFMASKPDAETEIILNEASQFMDDANSEMSKLVACMPNCVP